ncbi:O-antigen ligase family protein [Alsobacter sp. R-9]
MVVALVMAWLPAAMLGQTALSWGTNALIAGVLLLAREALALRSGATPGVPLVAFRWPALLMALVLGWIGIQLIPGVPGGLAHPVWGMAAEALHTPIAGRITVDPELTQLAALRLVTALALFWVAAHLAARTDRAYFLLGAVVAITAAYAIYGLVAVAGAAPAPGEPVARTVASTFPNRNTFATFAGMGLVVAAGLLLRLVRRRIDEAGSAPHLVIAAIIERSGGAGAVLGGACLLLGAALLSSGSRGGVLATGAGLTALVLLAGARRRGHRGRNLWTAVGLLGILALVGGAVVVGFGDVIGGRLSESGLGDLGRVFAYRTTLDAIAASPWLGYGYGTFASVFPMFHDGSMDVWMIWDLAHNTYLEVFLGLGLLGGSALVGSIGLVVVACWHGARHRKRHATIPAIAASVAVLAGTHALVDFSLQIEPVALIFAIILGVGFAQARNWPEASSLVSRQGVAS